MAWLLVALKLKAVLFESCGMFILTPIHRGHFSFRHSFANILQYFILSSKFFADGSANISSAVETTPVDFKCSAVA